MSKKNKKVENIEQLTNGTLVMRENLTKDKENAAYARLCKTVWNGRMPRGWETDLIHNTVVRRKQKSRLEYETLKDWLKSLEKKSHSSVGLSVEY